MSQGPVEALAHSECDAVLIGELAGIETIRVRLIRAGVPKDKIVILGPEK